MKRHEALIPLTHDHHHALAEVRKLRMAAEGAEADRKERSRRFLDFFRDDTLTHFREEEERVFPLVVEFPEARANLARVMLEHLQIHAAVSRLEGELGHGTSSAKAMLGVAGLLESHVRFEEKTLFPQIESLVGGSDLGTIRLSPRNRTPV